MNAKSLIVDKLFSFGNWITILAVIFMIAIFSKTINYALGIPTEYVFIWAISSGVVFSIFLAFKNIPPPLSKLQEENARNKADYSLLLEEHNFLQDEHDELVGKSNDFINEAVSKITELEEEISELKSTNKDLKTHFLDNEMYQKQYSANIAKFNTLKASLEKRIADLQEKLSKSDAKASELQKAESKISELESGLEAKASELQKVESKIAELESKLEAKASELQKVESKIAELKSESQTKTSEMQKAASERQAKIGELLNDVSELRKEKSELKEKLEYLQVRYWAFEDKDNEVLIQFLVNKDNEDIRERLRVAIKSAVNRINASGSRKKED